MDERRIKSKRPGRHSHLHEKLNVDVLALQEVDRYEDDEEEHDGGGWKTWLASQVRIDVRDERT